MRVPKRLPVKALVGVVAALSLAATPAAAQESSEPFACLTATVYVAQGLDTQLNALAYGTGESTFTPIGPPYSSPYNAIGFSPVDGFIYGIRSDGFLLRIDSAGSVHPVGDTGVRGINIGAFDDAGTFYITSGNREVLYEIDTATGTVARTIALSEPTATPDLTFIDGMLWGKQVNSPNLVRVDPSTGQVHRFAQSEAPASVAAGAAWTYGNGNLGLSDNTTGTIYQLAITDGSSSSPSFRLVSASEGPASGNNDGTSCPGQPADLEIVKEGPSPAFVGQSVSWTLTVRNHGPGISSGYTVTDTVPPGFSDVASPTPGCRVAGNTVTCGHGPQGVDEEATFIITATASSPSRGENTAQVVGNDRDPNPENDAVTIPAVITELVGLCRGTPVAVLGLMPATANPAESPCRTDDRWLVRIYQGDFLKTLSLVGTQVWGRTSAGERSAAGRADVATVHLTAPGLALSASGLHANATSEVRTSCTDTATAGSSYVSTLVVNGRSYTVGDDPLTIPLGLGAIHLNRQDVQGSTVTQRAIHVDLPGTLLDVAIAEARAGMACAATS